MQSSQGERGISLGRETEERDRVGAVSACGDGAVEMENLPSGGVAVSLFESKELILGNMFKINSFLFKSETSVMKSRLTRALELLNPIQVVP